MINELEFKRIYYSYYESLSLFGCKYVDAEVAQDIVQDVFLKVWRSELNFDNDRHLMGYLVSATKNGCLNHIRLSKTESLDTDRHFNEANLAVEGEDIDLMESNLYVNIFKAIEKLPEKRRLIFTMSYLDRMSVEEISAQLNISVNTVKTQRLRAKETLKKYLSEDYLSLCLLLMMTL